MLLLEEIHLIDIGILDLPELSFQVGDVFEDLLKHVIDVLSHVVLEGCTFTAENLGLLFVLVDSSCEIVQVVLYSIGALRILFLTIIVWILERRIKFCTDTYLKSVNAVFNRLLRCVEVGLGFHHVCLFICLLKYL